MPLAELQKSGKWIRVNSFHTFGLYEHVCQFLMNHALCCVEALSLMLSYFYLFFYIVKVVICNIGNSSL